MRALALTSMLALSALFAGRALAQPAAPTVLTGTPTTLSWAAPATNADGSTPPSIGGYNVYLAASDAALSATSNTVSGGSVCASAGPFIGCAISVGNVLSYQPSALPVGTYFAAITTWWCPTSGTAAGCQESVQSTHVTFAIGAAASVACLPKIQWPLAVAFGSVPSSVGAHDYYAVYVCNTPGGYTTVSYMGTMAQDAANIVNFVRGLYSTVQAAADCAASCSTPTGAESAFLAPIVASSRPKALVAFNGASLTRSVFALNPDGTLNPTAVAGEAVSVAAPCDETIRIPSAPAYFSVGAQSNVGPGQSAASVLPPGSFAICVVSLPIGSN